MYNPGWLVRLAVYADLPAIDNCYEKARRFMAATGNPNQWGTDRPARCLIEQDLSCGRLYVLERQGQVHGVFAFFPGPDPTYAYITGAWGAELAYHVIHRIASDGTFPGVFAAALAYCRDHASHLRIDTHDCNKTMRHHLEQSGFVLRGVIYLEDGSPRLAYDWIK